jgi:uncharacterized membrane protein
MGAVKLTALLSDGRRSASDYILIEVRGSHGVLVQRVAVVLRTASRMLHTLGGDDRSFPICSTVEEDPRAGA